MNVVRKAIAPLIGMLGALLSEHPLLAQQKVKPDGGPVLVYCGASDNLATIDNYAYGVNQDGSKSFNVNWHVALLCLNGMASGCGECVFSEFSYQTANGSYTAFDPFSPSV